MGPGSFGLIGSVSPRARPASHLVGPYVLMDLTRYAAPTIRTSPGQGGFQFGLGLGFKVESSGLTNKNQTPKSKAQCSCNPETSDPNPQTANSTYQVSSDPLTMRSCKSHCHLCCHRLSMIQSSGSPLGGVECSVTSTLTTSPQLPKLSPQVASCR